LYFENPWQTFRHIHVKIHTAWSNVCGNHREIKGISIPYIYIFMKTNWLFDGQFDTETTLSCSKQQYFWYRKYHYGTGLKNGFSTHFRLSIYLTYIYLWRQIGCLTDNLLTRETTQT
jgi:hypothetical protein